MIDPNDFHELCLTRRSIRKFKPDPIPQDVLDRIMTSATWAPSSMNRQTWKFYVLTDEMRDRLAALHSGIFSGMVDSIRKRYGDEGVEIRRQLFMNLGNAPVAIGCFTDLIDNNPDLVSCALACENLALAAHAEGYGALMMGSSLQIKDEIAFLCGVNTREMELVMCMLIGLPDETPEPQPRRKGRVVYASQPKDIK